MSLKNQAVAQRLAVCNDIGEASYVASLVAAGMVDSVLQLPTGAAIAEAFTQRCGSSLETDPETDAVDMLSAAMVTVIQLLVAQLSMWRDHAQNHLQSPHRYKLSPIGFSGESYVAKLAEAMFQVRKR